MRSPVEPVFAETVQPAHARESQWQSIIATGANHRRCHIFKSPAHYFDMSLSVPNPLALN